MAKKQTEWFENWFDTNYYHILYKKRNDAEASAFIDALIKFFNPPIQSNFLDLACGKGRHSIYLHQKNFNVVGLDLSHNSIESASKFTLPDLKFMEHDMRQPLNGYQFDYVLNLFTSFGYFDDPKDDLAVIRNAKQCLKPGGIFLLDYFNATKPNDHFDIPFTKEVDSIKFDLIKHIKEGRIIKEITVNDSGKISEFTEQVRIYSLGQFKQIFNNEGLTIENVFGSYDLEPYDERFSDRLILVARN